MPDPFVTLLGKSIRYAARLRGGGSALPGLFVEKISPDFVKNTLAQLPRGVVVISGTNGKTTTTKIVVELLQAHGLRVFTNRTGSNFVRGVAAALLGDMNLRGQLKADIAVLELDEAHAVKFIETIQPRYSLLLNVMRDQLDRFGEIDTTAKLLAQLAQATNETVVLNREDPRIAAIKDSLHQQHIEYFGLSDELLDTYRSDDDLHAEAVTRTKRPAAAVVLESLAGASASFAIDDQQLSVQLQLSGLYNVYNAAGALALARAILGDEFGLRTTKKALAAVRPAFGRGEIIEVGGQPIELVLVKNPSGFRLGLQSFRSKNVATMIAINDNYADGRDMSWLWDVDFSSLHDSGVQMVSGVRAYDMALRLQYDEIAIHAITPSLPKALRRFIQLNAAKPKRIYCTYTAMLALRRELGKITTVEVIA